MKRNLIIGLSIMLLFSSVFAFSENSELLNNSAIKLVKPKYPQEARTAKIQGEVKVKITVDKNGKVLEAEAISGDELLADACVEAALKSTFKTRKVNGKLVKYSGVLRYTFYIN